MLRSVPLNSAAVNKALWDRYLSGPCRANWFGGNRIYARRDLRSCAALLRNVENISCQLSVELTEVGRDWSVSFPVWVRVSPVSPCSPSHSKEKLPVLLPFPFYFFATKMNAPPTVHRNPSIPTSYSCVCVLERPHTSGFDILNRRDHK